MNFQLASSARSPLIFFFALLSVACTSIPYRLEPSGHIIPAPAVGEQSFQDYIARTQTLIRDAISPLYEEGNPFLGNYTIEEVVELRSPIALYPTEELDCSNTDWANRGFLLVHGLTDSAYNLRPLAEDLHKRFPCAIFYLPLLAGHGTVPGDSRITEYSDWLSTFDFALNALKQEVEEVYLLGYSAGASIIINYLANHNDPSVKAQILLAPGLKLKSQFASLAVLLQGLIPFVSTLPDLNAVKYESTSSNFAADYYQLLQKIDADLLNPRMSEPSAHSNEGTNSKSNSDQNRGKIAIPSLVVGSSDDDTVDALSINNFYCNNLVEDQRRMIWYQGENKDLQDCGNILVLSSSNTNWDFANHSHLALVAPPEDKHYGYNGVYRNCEHYSGSNNYDTCLNGNLEELLNGERNLLANSEILGTRVLRRGTFNPYYEELLNEIEQFLLQQ